MSKLYLYGGLICIGLASIIGGYVTITKSHYNRGYQDATQSLTQQWHESRIQLEKQITALQRDLSIQATQAQQQATDTLYVLAQNKEKTNEDANRIIDNLDHILNGMSITLHYENGENLDSHNTAACAPTTPVQPRRAKLSKELAKELVREAERADRVVHELNNCKVLLQTTYQQVEAYNKRIETFNQQEQ